MDRVESFINRLLKSKPDKQKLLNFGYNIDTVNSILLPYTFKAKNNEVTNHDYIIDDLLNKYDLSELVIGEFTFLNQSIYKEVFIEFGAFDLFRVAIIKNSNEIVILDEHEDTICQKCAIDELHFLEALLMADKFLNDNLFNNNDEIGYKKTTLEKAQKLA
jgi:hypothetical protein